jgi:hypothetical protein
MGSVPHCCKCRHLRFIPPMRRKLHVSLSHIPAPYLQTWHCWLRSPLAPAVPPVRFRRQSRRSGGRSHLNTVHVHRPPLGLGCPWQRHRIRGRGDCESPALGMGRASSHIGPESIASLRNWADAGSLDFTGHTRRGVLKMALCPVSFTR